MRNARRFSGEGVHHDDQAVVTAGLLVSHGRALHARWKRSPGRPSPRRLLDLPETCSLPEWAQLDGLTPWAKVRVGWNPRGWESRSLADGVSELQLRHDRPEGFALVQFWIDTRDTRNVSRATRFCHRFVARIQIAESRRQLTVDASQRPIARAASRCTHLPARAHRDPGRTGQIGLDARNFLPAQALNGFDADTNRRLGFAYQIARLRAPRPVSGHRPRVPRG